MGLLTDFIQTIQKNEFWEKEDRLLLAVSGGVDSMVMLELMTQLPKAIKPWLGVVHVNHQLREASDREEAAVKEICIKKNIPFYSTRWDKKDHPSSGTEVAARDFRYAFFQKAMKTKQAGYLLTAHHGEDQVE
ncbi:MAG: tRNA lysidine(34) synthetase TilS, partial [Pisciglobus halotolerans]|nr:tRNA lysidine(34) synthetase TilS [Pisciglobus halotolerans]